MTDTDIRPAADTFQETLDLGQDLVARARQAGADGADVVMFESISLEAAWRLGKLEDIERAECRDLGLRVLIGKRQAFVSTTDFSTPTLNSLVEGAVAMARTAPEDPHCALAPPDLLARTFTDLDLEDPSEPDTQDLIDLAAEAEATALAVKGITNSDGAAGSWERGGVVLVTSEGFAAGYSTTHYSISCAVLAGEGMEMEAAYDFHSAHHRSDLADPVTIGRVAAERALRALGPRRPKSAAVPVVYEDRVSQSLLRHFASAITGTGIARGTSFLKDKMGEAVFDSAITIIDDPHRRRGLASKPFDGEGVANHAMTVIDKGRLTTWFLDMATAHQLGLTTTGHATRSAGAPPAPGWTNLYMEAGTVTPDELIADIEQGLFVTSMFGPSVNPTTGDYSAGVSGLWIENGALAYPVNEITIAGNLIDMFKNLTPANDLTFRYGTNAPTLRVDGMTVAGA